MTGVQDGNAAREIEILTAFDIPDPTIFRPLGENRVNLPTPRGTALWRRCIKALLVFISDSPVKGRCTYI